MLYTKRSDYQLVCDYIVVSRINKKIRAGVTKDGRFAHPAGD